MFEVRVEGGGPAAWLTVALGLHLDLCVFDPSEGQRLYWHTEIMVDLITDVCLH